MCAAGLLTDGATDGETTLNQHEKMVDFIKVLIIKNSEKCHCTFYLFQTSTPVSVVRETGQAGNSITVMGYDVSVSTA